MGKGGGSRKGPRAIYNQVKVTLQRKGFNKDVEEGKEKDKKKWRRE